MNRARLAGLLSVALITTACGTRANFTANPAPETTRTIEQIIGGSGAPIPSSSAVANGIVPSQNTTGPVQLRGGSGIRNGTIKIGGLFPLSGGLSALGVPPA